STCSFTRYNNVFKALLRC
ncbi:hypothetical protein VCHC50A2_3308C, partial [Vibrio cholerae HC-50A2]